MNPTCLRITSFLILLLSFAGCSGTDTLVPAESPGSDEPFMSARDIDVLFSDSGNIEVRLTSPCLNKYTGQDPRMEFPEGFMIYTFGDSGKVASTIRGDWGIRRENIRLMEARGNVIVRNEMKNEQLQTEQLTWDELKHLIYTDQNVRITTPGKILYGRGLEADEGFSSYIIRNPSGQMIVSQDSV